MITANDVRESAFARAARGYKVSEVDELLEQAADSLEQLTAENAALNKKLELLAGKIQEYRDDEDSIRAALLTAQKSADKMLKEAEAQHDELISTAEKEAKQLVEDANQKASDALRISQEKSMAIVNDTREKANKVINEAKTRASRICSEASESCREEQEKAEIIRSQAQEFRQLLLQMYRDQFEVIKKGPVRKKKDNDIEEKGSHVRVEHEKENETASFDDKAESTSGSNSAIVEKAADIPIPDEPEPKLTDAEKAEVTENHIPEPVPQPESANDAFIKPEIETAESTETVHEASSKQSDSDVQVKDTKPVTEKNSGKSPAAEDEDADDFLSPVIPETVLRPASASFDPTFDSLKFGDDYNIEDDVDDEDEDGKAKGKGGFFRRKK